MQVYLFIKMSRLDQYIYTHNYTKIFKNFRYEIFTEVVYYFFVSVLDNFRSLKCIAANMDSFK